MADISTTNIPDIFEENESVKCNQMTLLPQIPQNYFESSTHDWYIEAAIFFMQKFFPNNIML